MNVNNCQVLKKKSGFDAMEEEMHSIKAKLGATVVKLPEGKKSGVNGFKAQS